MPPKCLASVSQVSRKCQTSRECIGETSIVYAYVKGATVECVYLGWLRPPPGTPQQQWCLRECECDVRVDRHATTHGVPYAIRTIFSPLFVSENSAALPISHSRSVYALRIRITHHSAAPALGNTTDHTSRIRVLNNSIKRRKPAGEGYVLRTTYPYYISSAESPRERAIYYALHIRIIYQALKAQPRELSVPHALHTRIMYQAPKARPRELWNTHYVSVLYIKRRTITRGEHNIHDPRSTRDRPEIDPRLTRNRPEIYLTSYRDRPEIARDCPRSTRQSS